MARATRGWNRGIAGRSRRPALYLGIGLSLLLPAGCAPPRGRVITANFTRTGSGAQEAADWGGSLWGAKEIDPEELHTRVRFEPRIPATIEAPISRAQVVWVPDTAIIAGHGLPSRQAAAIWWEHASGGRTVIIQSASVPGASAYENLSGLIAEGFFFRDLPMDSHLLYRRSGGIDLVVVSTGLTDAQLERLSREFEQGTE